MDPQRARRLRALFEAALRRPPEKRADWLEQHCPDASLRAEITALFESLEPGEQRLRRLQARVGVASPDLEDALRHRGHRIGPWRLIETLGRGGMGVVYLAERADHHFHKLVALKLLPLGVITPENVQRFRREREILARLEHPGIARLIDAGLTEEGTPYLVMEYVPGQRLDVYLDSVQPGTEDRLELFLRICDAVAYAHRNLVVHRDLKPENILVTETGHPKLVDFGIARLLVGEDMARELTRQDCRPLTPAYAAPELLQGQVPTTACDVYALGVVLYRMLTGRLPHDPEHYTDPARLHNLDHTPAPLPSERLSDQPRLARRMQGDLDNIVSMAMRAEPERRYSSVEALANDIRRHLAGLPVSARPATLGYRISRFCKRHQAGVAMTVFAGLLLVSATLISGLSAIEARRQAALAEHERDRAQMVVRFLTSLFESADPESSAGAAPTATDLLDTGARQVQTALADDPALQGRFVALLGRLQRQIGAYDRSEALLEQAIELLDSHASGQSSLIEALGYLAELRLDQGRHAQTEALVRRALALAEGDEAPNPDVIATLYGLLGMSYLQRDQLEAAIEAFETELALKSDAQPADEAAIATAQSHLGHALRRQGRLDEAEGMLRAALQGLQRHYGAEHLRVATAQSNLAQLLRDQERLGEAETLYRQALQTRRRVLGAEHPATLRTRYNLARLLEARGDLARARPEMLAVIDGYRKALGDDHPDTAQALVGLAWMDYVEQDFDAALSHFNQALDIFSRLYTEPHGRTVGVLNGIGRIHCHRGQWADGVATFREALAMAHQVWPEDHLRVVRLEQELGLCLAHAGRLHEALEPLERALHHFEQQLGPEHRYTVLTREEIDAVREALRAGRQGPVHDVH